MISLDDKKRIFSLLDLTSLHENDDAATIAALCKNASGPLGHAAAVCVYPQWVKEARRNLVHQSMKVATVANFPHGTDTLEKILAALNQSLQDGADEIDVVFPYRRYMQGGKKSAMDVIAACKDFVGEKVTLKVILETAVLANLSLIEEVSEKVIHAGADFLKTSTGKVTGGATLEAASTMLYAIKASDKPVGFKASGGVRTAEQAMLFLRLAEDVMGSGWVTAERFRIGTSGLSDLGCSADG